MAHLIAPSLLSANFAHLAKDIEMINRSEADWFHVDVMDGVFVPNISFGFPVIRTIKEYAQKPLDVHLMIVDPDRYLDRFKEAGADIISVQYEACTHLHRSIQSIKSLGLKAGVVLNPHTSVFVLEDILADVDMVLLMSVNPGFGGQKFIRNTLDKISRLRELILRTKSKALIEVDGGVNPANAIELIRSGAEVLVAGNSIFASDNPEETISKMKNIKI
ncbi:MAG: ribulose-phosphate 3-epimerase [Bacteroidales bacterium]|nr:ribulose-phosphate 3-epimerase [Bacteroidales bacterium]